MTNKIPLLSKRLNMVANMVEKCDILYDIGTDHAYIPIMLIKQNVCKKAVAADVKQGPLDVAMKNIKDYKEQKRITTKLGFGLDVIDENENSAVIIAGMGGHMICSILKRGMNKITDIKQIILQPTNNVHVLRKWLYNNKFDIFVEQLVKDNDKLYTVMEIVYTGSKVNFKPHKIFSSNGLIAAKHKFLDEYIEYIKKEITKLNKKIKGIKKSKAPDKEKIDYYKTVVEFLHSEINNDDKNK